MIKLLLINAMDEKRAMGMALQPLSLAYIASYLRENINLKNIQIVTKNAEIVHAMSVFKPDIVAISSVTQNYKLATNISNYVKQKLDIPVIVGGHHITALPNNLNQSMDIGVLGEGEQTMLELVETFEQDDLNPNELSKIDGIVFRDGKKLKITNNRKQIEPLDTIPFPARDLLDIKPNQLYIFTSRGCPYRCPYCSSSHFWKTIRFHSPTYVVNEIKELIEKYTPQCITIYDDLFIAKKERLREISNLIEAEGLSKNVEFSALARANLVDDEICILLKKMNITHMTCGFESGSPKILKYLKGLNVEQNAKAIELFKKYGFTVGGTFMIGIPNETISDMNMTLNFLRMNDFSAGDTYVMVPYPGTVIWEYAKSRNFVNDNMDWDLLSVDFAENWRETITVTDQVSREELYVMYQKFKDEWERKYLHGKNIFDVLRERGFGYIIKTGITNPKISISFIKNFLYANKHSDYK